ncbi:MAG: hypothetical protein SGJ27_07230 [Candidatus Melainabacteria bacterium]|nr:hypothetical protein [Candidatus Melainabacteria bacterium]
MHNRPFKFASFCLFMAALLIADFAPANAQQIQRESYLHSSEKRATEVKYPEFMGLKSRVEDAQPIDTQNDLSTDGFAGAEGGSGKAPSLQSQPQNKQYQKGEEVPYNACGGPPNGKQIGEGCQAGALPYYQCEPNTLSGHYPTPPPVPHLTSSGVVTLRAKPNSPEHSMELKVYEGVMGASSNDISQTNASNITAAGNQVGSDLGFGAHKQFQKAQAQAQGAAQGASEAMADAFNPTWATMLLLSGTSLENVANEASGSACSASQPVKTYANAIYLVQQAYKNIYLPMAVLLLLPGAVLTQLKGLISGGFMGNQNDEDAVSPFTGILRSMIAIFLIPASQLIISYTIDVGNSMQYEVHRNINLLNIYMWGDEQVFRAPPENARNQILPPSMFQVLGKLSEGPEALSGVESQSPATIMLQTLVNSTADAAAFGLVILCAFQIAMACYLLLMGPIAAALYAWPGGAGSLFIRVFANWVDAIINLALWRFWWCVVLLCIDVRLGWLGAFDLYTLWEMLMFMAFLIILMYVPFNPFDFKAGEMVSQIMSKSDQAVNQASSK